MTFKTLATVGLMALLTSACTLDTGSRVSPESSRHQDTVVVHDQQAPAAIIAAPGLYTYDVRVEGRLPIIVETDHMRMDRNRREFDRRRDEERREHRGYEGRVW